MADTTYGVRIRCTPDTSGNNLPIGSTVLYSSPTAVGTTKTELGRQRGTAVGYFDDTRPISSGKLYYWLRHEQPGMTDSAFIGPVDAEPTDLQVET
jgi:hypothetical protein